MRRREFVTLLGGATVAWPIAARAQQPDQMKRIGVLMSRAADDPGGQRQVAEFRQGLAQLGWTPGRNIEIEYHWHAGDAGRAQAFAKELVARNPDIFVANATPSLAAARQATRTIPIVFIGVADPVGQGFVPSLARPGGNITGLGLEEPGMGGKWLGLLKEIAPRVSRITVMFNPESAPYARMFLPAMEAASPSLAVELIISPVRSDAEIERVVTAAGREQAGGLIVLPDSYLFARREMLVTLAARHHLPGIGPIRPFATSGGLIAYGIDRVDLFQRAAVYVDRVLKGAQPADLPVQMPTKFELVINLKTAKALGLDVPPMLFARADEVIE